VIAIKDGATGIYVTLGKQSEVALSRSNADLDPDSEGRPRGLWHLLTVSQGAGWARKPFLL
jgi:hypothetical protein